MTVQLFRTGFFVLLALTARARATVADELRVPHDHATIQAALDAARDGDVVRVSRGVYVEALVIAGKSVTLQSEYVESRDPADRLHTVIDAAVYGQEELVRNDAAITVEADAGPQTRIAGFTIRNGDDGVKCRAKIAIVDNRFVNNNDGIDYESGGGICQRNVFVAHQDDAVDVDESSSVEVLDNIIRDCADDGVEIRLHDYRGPTIAVTLRNNVICGSGENGIQIIDYPDISDRRLRIERNLIAHSVMAGIGVMSDGVTREDFRAAQLPEPLDIVGNTLVDNAYGICGGGNAAIINNLIVRSRVIALKNVGPQAVVAGNLCWENAHDVEGDVPGEAPRVADPGLDANYRAIPGGPCTDAGAADVRGPQGRSIDAQTTMFRGSGPDIGRDEY